MAVTLREIAEACGVSPMTVSRVLSGKDNGKVSAVLRERILGVSQSLGYQPNHIARQLKYGVSAADSAVSNPVVTMLIPHPGFLDLVTSNSETLLEVFSGALSAVTERGVQLVTQPVSQSNQPCAIEWSWLSNLDSSSLILAPAPWFMFCLLELSRRGSRIALLSQNGFWPNVFSRYVRDWLLFSYHYEESSRYLTEYLLSTGYQRIAFAGLQSHLSEPNFPLVRGYEQGIKSCCAKQVIVIESAEHMRENLMQAYSEHPFDALVLSPVFGFIPDYSRSLAENFGLPEGVCIVSTTDRNDFCRMQPQISAMRFPFRQMGYDAAMALLDENFRAGERWYEGHFQSRGVLAVAEEPLQPVSEPADLQQAIGGL
ncbi:MAG: LacI family DNA-binding transcriptional regulator [Lentisphaeria bacterium]